MTIGELKKGVRGEFPEGVKRCRNGDGESILERCNGKVLILLAGASRERSERRVDDETLIEILDSGYVIGSFTQKL